MTANVLTASDIDLMPLFASLKSDGVTLTATMSGRQCLEKLRSSTPDLIILDEDLIDSRGSDICSRLKRVARLKRVPVLLLIPQRNSDRLRTEAALVGADEVLLKPTPRDELRAAVQRLLPRAARPVPLEAVSPPTLPPVG